MPTVIQPVQPANWARFSAEAASWGSEAGNNLPTPAGPQALTVIDPRKAWQWIRLLPEIAGMLAEDIVTNPGNYGATPATPDVGYRIDPSTLQVPETIEVGSAATVFGELLPTTPLGGPVIGWEFTATWYADGGGGTPTGPALVSKTATSVFQVLGGIPTNFFQIDFLPADLSSIVAGGYVLALTWAGPSQNFPVEVTEPPPPPEEPEP